MIVRLSRTLANEEPDVTIVALRPGAVDTEVGTSSKSLGAASMILNGLGFMRRCKLISELKVCLAMTYGLRNASPILLDISQGKNT